MALKQRKAHSILCICLVMSLIQEKTAFSPIPSFVKSNNAVLRSFERTSSSFSLQPSRIVLFDSKNSGGGRTRKKKGKNKRRKPKSNNTIEAVAISASPSHSEMNKNENGHTHAINNMLLNHENKEVTTTTTTQGSSRSTIATAKLHEKIQQHNLSKQRLHEQMEVHRNRSLSHSNMNNNANKEILNINSFMKASQSSFRNIEGNTFRLLAKKPIVALVIFVALGLLVAYISGFVILGGYITSFNPIENGEIPYWNEDVSELTPL